MEPYPLTLQLGMKRLHGHLFLAPGRLYFVCGKQGGAWMAVIGQSIGTGVGGLVGGVVGGVVSALGTPNTPQAPGVIDEAALAQAVAANEGSFIMEAAQIEEIKETMWWRLIRWNGKKFGLPEGLGKPLKLALGPWAKQHNVKTKGKHLV